jgi:hypothetical protein
VEFDLAETYNLSSGGRFIVHRSGSVPYRRARSTRTTGKVDFESNILEIVVDGARAGRTLTRMTKSHPSSPNTCSAHQKKQVDESLQNCARFAINAADTAWHGPAWRMNEAFGSADQNTRDKIGELFKAVDRGCSRHKGYTFHCRDLRKVCDESLISYAHPLTGHIVYCPEFFTRPNGPMKCHEHQKPGRPNWYPNQIGTSIREMAQLVSQGDIEDNAHGVTDILALDPKITLTNADNYELFAIHANIDDECKPISPGRSNSGESDPPYRSPSEDKSNGPPDHHSPDHGPSVDKSKIPWAPCNWAKLPRLGNSADCATLNVPLDYTSPDSKSAINLQLLRLKATKTPVKGSVLFNPGGPGDTAIDYIASHGSIYLE